MLYKSLYTTARFAILASILILLTSVPFGCINDDDDPCAGLGNVENISYKQKEIPKVGSTDSSLKIRYTYVPDKIIKANDPFSGCLPDLQGQTYNINPNSAWVTVFIYVERARDWYVKPLYIERLTKIEQDGTFNVRYFDSQSEIINAYIVKNGYMPDEHDLPDMNDPQVLAGVTIDRR